MLNRCLPGLCFIVLGILLCGEKEGLSAPADDRLLIKFLPVARGEVAARTPSQGMARLQNRLSLPVGSVLAESRLSTFQRQRRLAGRRPDLDGADVSRFMRLKLPPGVDASAVMSRLRNLPLVEYVERDGIGYGGTLAPNDPGFGKQWYLSNLDKGTASIHTLEAWDITIGNPKVILAVLDTGVRMNLDDFAGRLVPGYDFVNVDDDPTDDNGHGTAVASVACATGANGASIAGVDWKCKLMPVKVLDDQNQGFYADWADGIDFAVSNGCKVINLSAGGSSANLTLSRAITNAIAHGVIFVTITHNDSANSIRFPGRMPEVITVGATDSLDRHAGFSNYGPQIDLVAPGTNMTTESTSGGISTWWGTSFSAPLVAGVCALMAGLRPDLNQEQAALLLELGAEDHVGDGNDTDGFDPYYGWGRLNAYNSIVLATTRIHCAWGNDSTILSWTSPANAADKRPYLIEFTSAVNGLWEDVTLTGHFEYGADTTTWVRHVGQAGGYYRLRLRSL